jgi:hypothetical protein
MSEASLWLMRRKSSRVQVPKRSLFRNYPQPEKSVLIYIAPSPCANGGTVAGTVYQALADRLLAKKSRARWLRSDVSLSARYSHSARRELVRSSQHRLGIDWRRHDRRSLATFVRAFSARIGRSPSTVSREPPSDIAPWVATDAPAIAHLRAHERARLAKPGNVASSGWLRRSEQARLDECCSAERISLHLPALPQTARPECLPGNDLPGSV